MFLFEMYFNERERKKQDKGKNINLRVLIVAHGVKNLT